MSREVAKSNINKSGCSQSQRVQDVFQRAKELSSQLRHDYAHELFAHCVTYDSSNLVFVEAMLANLRAKFGDKKKRPSILKFGGGRSLKKAISRADWPEVFKLGIAELKDNPRNVPALRALADASAARHQNEVELVYLKQALDAAPKDADVNRHCARSLARMCQFDQAIACWHRVEVILPGNKEAREMISKLAQDKILHAAELREAARKAKEKAAMALEAVEDEVPAKEVEVVLTPRQKLERAIAENPSNVGLYIELAQLMIDDRRWNDAETVLQRCVSACGEDRRVTELLERVRLLRFEEQQKLNAAKTVEEPATPLPWLEIGLACAGIVLLFQLAPSMMTSIPAFLTANWKTLLLVANILFLPVLFLFRARMQKASASG